MARTKQQDNALDDLAMMSDPRRWPGWPWLPMKRNRNNNHESAVLHADAVSDKPTVLYLVNLFQVTTYFPTSEMAKTKEYPTFEAILADGWVVD